ncbi:MAG: PQQ-binding-like beta-propeller repeat protein [bacterium]|nr:PQQ-binding-like beta-propeller repeat protein [bacterium]
MIRLNPGCLILIAALLATSLVSPSFADDWPTYRHDNRRSGITSETLDIGALAEQWRYTPPAPPMPAWHGPAKWDAYAGLKGLRSMRNYDPAFYVAVVGDAAYFGSSVEDCVYCLDTESGDVRWSFDADGPVRITPTVVDGKAYFGSDDGYAYCLNVADGALIWKYTPTEDGRLIANDGKLIPMWPCRTGVLVDAGTAYFGAGLVPWRESFLCAVDAATGHVEGPGRFRKSLNQVTIEGAFLASPTKLYVPQGRSAPMVIQRDTGEGLGTLEGGGGVFAVLTPDQQIAHGPGNKQGWITVSNAETRDKIASFEGAVSMVVTEDRAYVLSDTNLVAVDRASSNQLWNIAADHPFTLILAGDVLLAGGQDSVAAYAVADGSSAGSVAVDGRAYGLAVANGRLYASTDTGIIHCFK